MPTLRKIIWLANPRMVAEAALAHYDLEAARLVLVSTSYDVVYRLQAASGDYTLRLHRLDEREVETAANVSWLNSEMVWMQAISRDTDVVVPQPMANLAGELVTVVLDEVGKPALCSLRGWLAGRFYNKGLRGWQLARVGEMTAKLHNFSERFVSPPGFVRHRADGLDGQCIFQFAPLQTDVREVEEAVLRAYGDNAAATDIVVPAIRRIWASLAEFGAERDRFGLIHTDIHQWNYLFWHGTVRLLDFNNTGYAHYLYDLAVTLHNLLDRADYSALRAALLQGYQRTRALPPNYHRFLRDLIAVRCLQHVLYRPLTMPLDVRHRWWSGVARGLEYLQLYLQDKDGW